MTTETILTDDTKEAVDATVAAALGDAYDCNRVWSAWSYGTMSSDDFSLVAEDSSRPREITDAAIQVVLQSEQVRAWKRDAERYRTLRSTLGFPSGGKGGIGRFHVSRKTDPGEATYLHDKHLDAAIDGATEKTDMTESSIISDEEVEVAFKGTDFGDVNHRKLLEASVLKVAMGLYCGHTITQIMKRLGLISKTEKVVLRRGKDLMREAYGHLTRNGG